MYMKPCAPSQHYINQNSSVHLSSQHLGGSEISARGSEIQDHSLLYSNFEASLSYLRPGHK